MQSGAQNDQTEHTTTATGNTSLTEQSARGKYESCGMERRTADLRRRRGVDLCGAARQGEGGRAVGGVRTFGDLEPGGHGGIPAGGAV